MGALRARFERLPGSLKFGALLLPFVLLPLVLSSDYHMQVAIDTLIYMLLAIGLNIAVGWAGLLDLGYVAFFGFGAYMFAWLASDHFDQHWQIQWLLPVVIVATALLGFLVGLPSRRLTGDYLAIVTLFFLQIFVTLLLNADRLNLPFREGATNLTRGPNGISDLDPLTLFGWKLETIDELFYFILGAFALVFVALAFVNDSRTGRAWRALREDTLAAEQLSMPVNRLKLLAFAMGAGVGGLTGAVFAAEQSSIFPVDIDIPRLITLYAMVILGGLGSLPGVVVGAIVINLSLEALKTPENASWIFFLVLLVALPFVIRPFSRWLVVVVGTIAFGFVVRGLANVFWDGGTNGTVPGLARVDGWVDAWVLSPADITDLGKIAYLLLVASILGLTLVHGWWRTLGFIPVLYLAVCVWENVMVAQPAVSRYILIGAMLVALMASRPQGLFGSAQSGDRLMAERLLELKRVSKAFGGLKVIDELDLHVDEGEIVSVIGPNGAGKTTLFNVITGIYPPDGGEVLLDGRSLLGLEPHEICNRGIARTFQTLRLFLNMTVKENVMAAAYGRTRAGVVRSIFRTPGQRREEREIHALAEEKLGFFGQRLMGYRWNQPAYSLSYANRRRLEIARATATGRACSSSTSPRPG